MATTTLKSSGVSSAGDNSLETAGEKEFRKELEYSLKQSLEILKRVKRTGSTKGLKTLDEIL
jgi:hypothetical protein